MALFRIAHLSDLHFASEPNRDNRLEHECANWVIESIIRGKNPFSPASFMPDIAIKLARQLSIFAEHLDALVVTGDLATTGSHSDITVAKDFCQFGRLRGEHALPLQLSPFFGASPAIFLPGNHDRYQDVALFPLSKNFESLFGEGWDLGQSSTAPVSLIKDRVRLTVISKQDNASGQDEYLAVCAADFSLRSEHDGSTKAGYLAQGKVYPDVLDWLCELTEAVNAQFESSVAVIWAMHFPPSFPTTKTVMELQGFEELKSRAQKLGVSIFLAGHIHENRDSLKEGLAGPRILCASTALSAASEDRENISFSIIDFHVNKGQLTGVHPSTVSWNWDTGTFEGWPAV